MHADRQHLWRLCPFGVQHVEAVFQIGKELLAGVKPLWRGKAHIVGLEGIGYDQVRLCFTIGALHLGPER
ncbi:hypothetical protein D3C78_1617880 [compost metagenome]